MRWILPELFLFFCVYRIYLFVFILLFSHFLIIFWDPIFDFSFNFIFSLWIKKKFLIFKRNAFQHLNISFSNRTANKLFSVAALCRDVLLTFYRRCYLIDHYQNSILINDFHFRSNLRADNTKVRWQVEYKRSYTRCISESLLVFLICSLENCSIWCRSFFNFLIASSFFAISFSLF